MSQKKPKHRRLSHEELAFRIHQVGGRRISYRIDDDPNARELKKRKERFRELVEKEALRVNASPYEVDEPREEGGTLPPPPLPEGEVS